MNIRSQQATLAIFNRALGLQARSLHEEAIEEFHRALYAFTHYQDVAICYSNIALSYECLGNKSLSEHYFKKSVLISQCIPPVSFAANSCHLHRTLNPVKRTAAELSTAAAGAAAAEAVAAEFKVTRDAIVEGLEFVGPGNPARKRAANNASFYQTQAYQVPTKADEEASSSALVNLAAGKGRRGRKK